MAPIAVPFIALVYVIYALLISMVLVVGTLGLVFLSVNEPDSVLKRIWGRLDKLSELTTQLTSFARAVCLPAGAIGMALSIGLLVLVNNGFTVGGRGGERARVIVAMVFYGISLVFGIILLGVK